MIKAVVFDLDHTLFDRYETLRQVVPFFRERFKITEGITDEFIAEKICWADKQYVHNGWHQILAYLCENNVFAEEIIYDEYEAYLLSCFRRVAAKYHFTIPTLEEIKSMGYKIGIITNSKSETQNCKIDLIGVRPFCDEIIISGDTPYEKPQGEIFQLMAEKLGVETSEMMYVGDHPRNDVDASRKAGCTPVWVKTTGNWIYPEIPKCELQVETIAEIPEILKKVN